MLCHYKSGFGNRAVRVAALKLLAGEQVAALMQHRRALGQPFRGGGHGRQFLVCYVDQRQRLVQRFLMPAGYQRDRVANVAGTVPLGDHHIPVGDQVPGLVEWDILRG